MGHGSGLKVSVRSLLVRKSAVAADLQSLLGSEDFLPQPTGLFRKQRISQEANGAHLAEVSQRAGLLLYITKK